MAPDERRTVALSDGSRWEYESGPNAQWLYLDTHGHAWPQWRGCRFPTPRIHGEFTASDHRKIADVLDPAGRPGEGSEDAQTFKDLVDELARRSRRMTPDERREFDAILLNGAVPVEVHWVAAPKGGEV